MSPSPAGPPHLNALFQIASDPSFSSLYHAFVFPPREGNSRREGNSPRGGGWPQKSPAGTWFGSGSWPAELLQSVTFTTTKKSVLFGFITFPLIWQGADQTHSCRIKPNLSPFFKAMRHQAGFYLKVTPRSRACNFVFVKKERNPIVPVRSRSHFVKSLGLPVRGAVR